MSPRYLTLCVVLTTFIIALSRCGPEPQPPLPPNIANICYCSDTLKPDSLCYVIPHEIAIPDSLVNQGYGVSFDSLRQPYFDIFSWQSFVALNWPSDNNGNPVPGAFKTDNTSWRVWEHYADPDTVFGPVQKEVPPAVFAEAHSKKKKVLHMRSKFQDVDSVGLGHNAFFEADGNALIDQNMNYVVFEEKINPDELAYIDAAGLRTQAGQERWTDSLHHSIDLPGGTYDTLTKNGRGSGGRVGAIEMKASWRILIPGKDSMDHYYHQPAIIYIDGAYTTNHQPLKVEQEVGLVGLHIIHKTSQNFGKFMVWSTFEHEDNVPDNMQSNQQAGSQEKQFSFYNPHSIGAEVNAPPVPHSGDNVVRWSPTMPYARGYGNYIQSETPDTQATQVVRLYPVYYYTELVNQQWRNKLKGTVWEHYKLIGSQWGQPPDGPPFDTISAPQFLGNSTMETYIQQNAGCINCHGDFAKIAGHGNRPKSDFSFLFGHATLPLLTLDSLDRPKRITIPK